MPLQNRIATCDICGYEIEELDVRTEWPGWAIIDGIGACAPEPGESIRTRHHQTYLCHNCREPVSEFINELQEKHK